MQPPGGADDSAVGVLAPVVGHLPDLQLCEEAAGVPEDLGPHPRRRTDTGRPWKALNLSYAEEWCSLHPPAAGQGAAARRVQQAPSSGSGGGGSGLLDILPRLLLTRRRISMAERRRSGLAWTAAAQQMELEGSGSTPFGCVAVY